MEKLVILTVTVDVYAEETVETISYESKEMFKKDCLSWQNEVGNKYDQFKNTSIFRNSVNDLSAYDGGWEVYTLEEFFEERKVN
jgi:hypothetical protein